MKITLLLGTATIMVLTNAFAPGNSIGRANEINPSVAEQPSPTLTNLKLKPKRQLRRLTVGGIWDTTEGELTLNQGGFVTDTSTDGQHLEPSAVGENVLGIYNKRGGSIRANFIEGSSTEVEGYWMQDFSHLSKIC